MAAFLGIYSKANKTDPRDIQAVTDDFKLGNTREVVTRAFPGFTFCFASKFADALFDAGHRLSFTSGHMSFAGLDNMPAGNAAKKLDHCLSQSTAALPLPEGAFAALHYNGATHVLTLANDKFGIFPLFIFENSRYVIVSNEYQPLVQVLAKKERQPDYDAIAEFFTLGVTLGNKTFYRQVKNLPAATCATAKNGRLTFKKYWQPEPVVENKTPELFAKELLDIFSSINRECAGDNVAELCLLSAGADSRLILATLSDEQRRQTAFFTSNLSFLDPAEDKDVIGASLLAEKFGLRHRVEKISFYENQFSTAYFDTERALRNSQVYGGWHGGELLGGYCLKAAPVQQGLTYKEVHKKLAAVFSWRFRLRLTQHPYKAYLQEKEKFAQPARELLFMTEQLTRSFFTNIYGGTKGHWVQPYQLANHGFSPFWDSRFLQKLMQIPLSMLADYALYNQVLKLCQREFTAIGCNSPLTNRPDSVLPKIITGLEPKSQVPDTHHQAYTACMADKSIWQRHFYRRSFKDTLANRSDALSRQWLDFETWYARYF